MVYIAPTRYRDEPPQTRRPSTLTIWMTAARPHTLTASLSPCLVAYADCQPLLQHQLAWTLFCLTVQLGTNLHNDYADFVRGADTDKRVGQARATAMGWLTPKQTCIAATLMLTVTLLSGVYLLYSSSHLSNLGAWFLILSSVFNAFAYTGGPYPLGYLGLGDEVSIAYSGYGDIFVFIYFGLVATWMLPFLMYDELPISVIMHGVQVGLLAINVLVVNNLRDRRTDVSAGKYTTAVRFGRRFSLAEYCFCNFVAYLLVLVDAYHSQSLLRLAPLLSLVMVREETKAVFSKEGRFLNPHVGGAAKVQFVFCVLLSFSVMLSGSVSATHY
jgi:1,4-dihydroxy-2-naphthoate octaprenyltransferase